MDNGEPLRGFEQEKARLRTVIQREEFRNDMECRLVKKATGDYCNFLKKKKKKYQNQGHRHPNKTMEVRDIKDVKSLGFYKQLVVGDQETTRIECF